MGDETGVVLVRPQRYVQVLLRPAGEAHVVEVGVGEDDRVDVAGFASQRL
jgi:hypothetical protein